VHSNKIKRNVVETTWLAKFSGLTIYSFNSIPPLIVSDAQVKSVKQTCLVNFGHTLDLFVTLTYSLGAIEQQDYNVETLHFEKI